MKIELSPDQNTLTVGRVKYEAVEINFGCDHCAFSDLFSLCEGHPIGNDNYGACYWMLRKDRRDIIWVKKEVAE